VAYLLVMRLALAQSPTKLKTTFNLIQKQISTKDVVEIFLYKGQFQMRTLIVGGLFVGDQIGFSPVTYKIEMILQKL